VRIVLLSPGPARASSAQRWMRDLILGLDVKGLPGGCAKEAVESKRAKNEDSA
jgi:hypothetical protein